MNRHSYCFLCDLLDARRLVFNLKGGNKENLEIERKFVLVNRIYNYGELIFYDVDGLTRISNRYSNSQIFYANNSLQQLANSTGMFALGTNSWKLNLSDVNQANHFATEMKLSNVSWVFFIVRGEAFTHPSLNQKNG
jgi:hypothetical protein